MSLIELLILVVIAGIVGALAEFLVGFTPGGLIGSVIVGVLGALMGEWLTSKLLLPRILPIQVGVRAIELVWAMLGSIMLVMILSQIRGRLRAQ